MDAADNLLQSKLTSQKLTPRKTTYLACPSHSRGRGRGPGQRVTESNRPMQILPPSRPAPPPPSPTPRREYQRTHNENLKEVDEEESRDPASKIWAKIRRCSTSSGSYQSRERNPSTSTVTSVTASISLPFSPEYATESRALRRKKTVVDSGNVHLMQRQRLVGISSNTGLTDRTNMSMFDDTTFNSQRRPVPKASGKSRRGSGRWSIGNWWG